MSTGDDFQAIAAHFPDPFRLMLRDSCASTNDELQSLASNGAPHGLILLSHEQTNGRGRRGNTWSAAPSESLTFSILVHPQEPKALWPRLALATGLALAEALESFGCQPGIKWPNDLWLEDRKAAGILVEAGENFAIVGIGLNVHTTEFPGDLADSATSLALTLGEAPSRPEVLAAIIQRFAVRHRGIGADFSKLIEGINQRCVLSGKRVILQTSNGPKCGIVQRLGSGGELLLDTSSGTEALIHADEVRIVNK